MAVSTVVTEGHGSPTASMWPGEAGGASGRMHDAASSLREEVLGQEDQEARDPVRVPEARDLSSSLGQW